MSLLGEGAVAIWHDIAPEGIDEFYAWHGRQHMPERVGIPGFLRGRRYIALEADLDFFNLYEATTPEVLTGPGYQERLNNPTPWTVATVKHFRDVARSLCRVAASFGNGEGGLVATWRYDVPPDMASVHTETMRREILPALAGRGIVAGAHLLVGDTEASAVKTEEVRARGGENVLPSWMIVLEGWGEEAPFRALCREALSRDVLAAAHVAGEAAFGLYQLQATITPADIETASA